MKLLNPTVKFEASLIKVGESARIVFWQWFRDQLASRFKQRRNQ